MVQASGGYLYANGFLDKTFSLNGVGGDMNFNQMFGIKLAYNGTAIWTRVLVDTVYDLYPRSMYLDEVH